MSRGCMGGLRWGLCRRGPRRCSGHRERAWALAGLRRRLKGRSGHRRRRHRSDSVRCLNVAFKARGA